jgi:hypothetical protein
MQVVNLMNDAYPALEGSRLAEDVLRTLTALLAGNEASRSRFRNEVGYEMLQVWRAHPCISGA